MKTFALGVKFLSHRVCVLRATYKHPKFQVFEWFLLKSGACKSGTGILTFLEDKCFGLKKQKFLKLSGRYRPICQIHTLAHRRLPDLKLNTRAPLQSLDSGAQTQCLFARFSPMRNHLKTEPLRILGSVLLTESFQFRPRLQNRIWLRTINRVDLLCQHNEPFLSRPPGSSPEMAARAAWTDSPGAAARTNCRKKTCCVEPPSRQNFRGKAIAVTGGRGSATPEYGRGM